MAKQTINLGTADKGNGDPLRTAFSKVNSNFTELYDLIGPGADLGAVDQDIVPAIHDTYDLGNVLKKWRGAYFSDEININGFSLKINNSGILSINDQQIGGSNDLDLDGGAASTFYDPNGLNIDGGSASTVFSASEFSINGGGA